MSLITTIEDLRRLAQKRVPRMFYDYADSGSWTESTYRANESDFAAIKFRQRVARNIDERSIRASMLGQDMAMPVALAPTGLAGMQHADGEILTARAAAAFGLRYTLSTMSICSLEDIAEHVGQPFWFQLYVMRDRAFIEQLIERAKAAGVDALVLTLDLQILGQRHKDLINGLSAPPETDPAEHPQHGDQTALGDGHARYPTPWFRQYRRACEGRCGHEFAVGVDRPAIRPAPELGRCGMDQKMLGRQADHQGHP